METPTKLIIFVPDSYNNITLDAEGNISKYDAKEGWKKTYNMGAYEELSDALVRAGFATVRFAREKGEKNLVMDLVTKKEIVEAYLDREEYDGDIILLAHGLGNTELKHIVSERRVSGIISLCGAAMGMWESYVNRGVWLGGNRKRLEKQYQNQMEHAPQALDFLKISRSKRVEEFVEIAKETPVFLGYVEYDPYYDDKLVDEIRAAEEGKIEYHYLYFLRLLLFDSTLLLALILYRRFPFRFFKYIFYFFLYLLFYINKINIYLLFIIKNLFFKQYYIIY